MDTIACETCGAHFVLSTPSAWSQQQGMFDLSSTKFRFIQSIPSYALIFLYIAIFANEVELP